MPLLSPERNQTILKGKGRDLKFFRDNLAVIESIIADHDRRHQAVRSGRTDIYSPSNKNRIP